MIDSVGPRFQGSSLYRGNKSNKQRFNGVNGSHQKKKSLNKKQIENKPKLPESKKTKPNEPVKKMGSKKHKGEKSNIKVTDPSKTKHLSDKTVDTVSEYVQSAIKRLDSELGSSKQIIEISNDLFESIENIEALKKEDIASSDVNKWSENIAGNVIYEYMDDLSDSMTSALEKVLLTSMDETLAQKQCNSFRPRIKNYIGFNFADKLFDELKSKIIESKKS